MLGALVGGAGSGRRRRAKAEGGLRQVVGAEAEELGVLGDLAGAQRGARQLDHGADEVGRLDAGRRLPPRRRRGRPAPSACRARSSVATSGIMISGSAASPVSFVDRGRGLEDRAHLHLVDLGIGDAEAAAAMAEHRVGLVQLRGAWRTVSTSTPAACATSAISAVGVRQELVQRRVEQADRHRQAAHDAEELDEVVALHRQDLGQRRARGRPRPRPGSSRARRRCGSASKNMCSVRHRPMPSAPKRARGAGVERRLGVGAHLERRTSSAQPISVAKSPDSSGWIVGTSPSMTSPVAPSMVMMSPSFTVVPRTRHRAAPA